MTQGSTGEVQIVLISQDLDQKEGPQTWMILKLIGEVRIKVEIFEDQEVTVAGKRFRALDHTKKNQALGVLVKEES